MQKGDSVYHKVTRRFGKVHSFSKKHPGWIKVQWDGDQTAYRYEAEELVTVSTMVDLPGHECAPRSLIA